LKCNCGRFIEVETSVITSERNSSCGKCLYYKDIVGYKFNLYEVIKYLGLSKKREHTWICQCKCGKKRAMGINVIFKRPPKGCISCGKKGISKGNKFALKHGYTSSKEPNHALYQMRNRIMTRCYNSKKADYPYYQGKGITVYQEWNEDPASFIIWGINNGWEDGLTIDRIDSNKNYDPTNCRFVTIEENLKSMHKSKTEN